jgi:predicted esterase
MLRKALFFLALCVALLQTSCGAKTDSPSQVQGRNPEPNRIEEKQPVQGQPARSAEKPTPPLQLAVPAALPEKVGELDLKNKDSDELLLLAQAAAGKKLYNVAAAAQYWHVQKAKQGQYDLACYLAQISKVDPAFYWLQLAAIDEGVDTQHAQRDEDLESLRADPRWGKVLRYMQDCNRYFESTPITRTVLIIPRNYKKPAEIPAVVWLHGLGSRPEGFVNDGCQDLADKLNIAFIGVSGTKARGPRSFVWADEIDKDAKRLRDALAEVSDRVTVKKGQIITFGFSQGAQVGLEIAVRDPELYAGSIVLSPGANFHLREVKPSPMLAQRGFVVSCGAKEHPGNVRLTTQDAEWLRQAKAKVIHKAYAGVAAHSFPEDFQERFPEWVKFILDAPGK